MNNVLLLRTKLSMTQDDFADYCGISRITVARCETGSAISMATAKKIARACDVSISYVLGDAEESEPKTQSATMRLTDADLNAIVQRVQSTGLRGELVELLKSLTPAQEQRVLDFVRGLKSSDTE